MNDAKEKIKILLVDDHPVVRKGLWSCLEAQPDLEIVGEAGTGPEAIQKTQDLAPHVVLMDFFMPDMDGAAVTEALRTAAPQSKVLVLSMHRTREGVQRIIAAGASGYVVKDASPEELVRAIKTVSSGQPYFSSSVANIAGVGAGEGGGESDTELTEREREVLALIAQGQSNKEVANNLNIGVRTVETHRERIMRKLDINSVAGLTKFAISNGIASMEPKQGR